MSLPSLKDFYLVGGTALSLLYGHRISIDLDLFSTSAPDTDQILADIRSISSSVDIKLTKPQSTVLLEIESGCNKT